MRSSSRKVERFWARYAGSLAFLALIIVGSIGFARIENARYESCQAGNVLRKGLRQAEQQNIAQIRATNPKLFPEIAPAVFKELQDEAIERAVEHISVNYADHACGTRINLPLTGAQIVLPP